MVNIYEQCIRTIICNNECARYPIENRYWNRTQIYVCVCVYDIYLRGFPTERFCAAGVHTCTVQRSGATFKE